jgi:dihydropteroate synthase
MGIVNVTPDSFSDGGLYIDADAAIAHGLALAREGAHVLDVGGESTRPGAQPVPEREELARVLPVIEGLAGARPALPGRVELSIDTSKAAVAEAALRAGASFVNDVTALRADPRMAEVIAGGGARCCLMHMRGDPRTMQLDPRYKDVVEEVKAFLAERAQHAVAAGVARERIVLDPGIGFGKTVEHNLQLLRRLDEICALGFPVLVGTSRKGFLGRVLAASAGEPPSGPGEPPRPGEPLGPDEPPGPGERLAGTIATNVLAYERGARIFRVHDVAPVRDALAVAAATLGRWPARSAGTTATS